MTREIFEELMQVNSDYTKYKNVCRITEGAIIVGKHMPGNGIDAAEHDKVYSVDIDQLVQTGITSEEVTKLRELGWFIDEELDCLAHFA